MKPSHSISNRAAAGVLLLALTLSAAFAGAAQANDSGNKASCRQETKRVAVWPKGPKSGQQAARFENREVTICDGKVVAQRAKDRAIQANDSGS